MSKTTFFTAAVLIAVGPGALAQPQGTSTPTTVAATDAGSNKSDPNRIVCQKEEQIGTRLGAHKVCLTVQQWKERQLQDQDEVHRVQMKAYYDDRPG